jgi:hypothetical protein
MSLVFSRQLLRSNRIRNAKDAKCAKESQDAYGLSLVNLAI